MKNQTNVSRRQLMRILPVAALTGASLKIANVNVQAIEVKPEKRYLFKFNNEYLEQKDIEALKGKLISLGFPDAVVINGDVELYELGE